MKISKEEWLNPPDPLKAEDISVMGLNPLCPHMHMARQSMHIGQISQAPPLNNAERPMVWNGITDIDKVAICVRVPKTCTIIKVVANTIICRTLDYREIFKIDIPLFTGNHGRFGFIPELLSNKIFAGAVLQKGEILTKPRTLDGPFLKNGIHLNVLVATHPGSAEDGAVMADDIPARLAYDTVTTIVIPVKENDILLNLYGRGDSYQPFPAVGERVASDGVVAAVRNVEDSHIPAMLSQKALRKVMHGDMLQHPHGCAGAKILDIQVVRNTYGTPHLQGPHTAFLDSISSRGDDEREAIESVVKWEIANNPHKRNYKMVPDPDLTSFLVRNDRFRGARAKVGRSKLSYQASTAPAYLITIKVHRENVELTRGGKITDRSSTKQTVTSLVPAASMPIINGKRVDLIIAKEAGINRTIPSRDIEQYLNAADVICSNMIRTILGVEIHTELSGLNDGTHLVTLIGDTSGRSLLRSDIRQIISSDDTMLHDVLAVLYEFSNIVQPVIAEVMEEARLAKDMESVWEAIIDIVYHNITIPLTIDYLSEHPAYRICEALVGTKFEPQYGMVTHFTHPDGTPIEVDEPLMTGPVYIYVLDKDTSEASASASQALQTHGLPCTRSNAEKYASPISRYPVRSCGTDEVIAIAGALGGSTIAPMRFLEFFDRLTSTQTQMAEIRAMLETGKPTGQMTLVNRHKVPYGKSRSLALFKHMINTHGCDLKFTKPPK